MTDTTECEIAPLTLDSIRVGLIIQQITHCHPDTRVLISAAIDRGYDIHPAENGRTFTRWMTITSHAIALIDIARIIQNHTAASDGTTLTALASVVDQYTFTPRHQEAA